MVAKAMSSKGRWVPRNVQTLAVQETAVQPIVLKNSQQGPVAQLDLGRASAGLSKTGWFTIHSARACDHFELCDMDAACMEADGSVSTLNLLPVTAGSRSTAKRRFRRRRCRQQARLLAQFPQLEPSESLGW